MAEGYRWNGRMITRRRDKRCRQRGENRVDPEFLVKALQQLQARFEAPRELREDLVLLVSPRVRRVGTWLAVVVAHVLIPAKEPQPIAHCWSANIGGEVLVLATLVPACRLTGARNWAHDPLTRETRG